LPQPAAGPLRSRRESERGDRETHKFQWDCTSGIAYLNGTVDGRGKAVADLDVSSSRGAWRLSSSWRPVRTALAARRFSSGFDKTLVLLAYFNAGIRAVDIRNPFEPKEIARFIPEVTANTTKSCTTIDGVEPATGSFRRTTSIIDDRGYIYAVDRASTGLHIVDLTGPARQIVGLDLD
jgi:hypothetical protein